MILFLLFIIYLQQTKLELQTKITMNMRKFLFICLTLIISGNLYSVEKNLDNGLGLKLFVGIPKDGYGALIESYVPYVDKPLSYPDVSPVFGLSLDSRWYLTKPAKLALAINARWADVSYAYHKNSIHSVSLGGDDIYYPFANENPIRYNFFISHIDISALGVGFLGTCYFNEKMGLDLYYNVAPNLLIQRQDVSENYKYEYNKYTFAMGVTHFVGLDFRYKIVQIGSELKLGTPKFQNWGERVPDNYDYNAQLGCSDFRATNLRFFIGVKF